MKTKLSFILILGALVISSSSGFSRTIKSTYIGPIGGNWSDPANWSPAIVPNNTARQKFDVSIPGARSPA